jgi:triosephosphate isomerase
MTSPRKIAAPGRKPLVIGNWKMHGDVAFIESLLAGLRKGWRQRALTQAVDVGVCPPSPYIGLAAARLAGSALSWGAQNISAHERGAYTGEVAGSMLADLACTWSLIGHSERRALFGETDAQVAAKVEQALASGVTPVICVGETLQERESGQTEEVLGRQIDAVCADLQDASGQYVLAYEPVWAIGTGLTATPAQAQTAHRFLRNRLLAGGVFSASDARIVYGGSVKPGNAAELFSQPDVDGGLIGGASLVADDFLAICRAAAGVA